MKQMGSYFMSTKLIVQSDSNKEYEKTRIESGKITVDFRKWDRLESILSHNIIEKEVRKRT